MGLIIDQTLEEITGILDGGLNARGAQLILKILDGPPYSEELLEELVLYSELLPLGQESPFTREQRYLHFLWDAFDKLPVCLYATFGILFRRLIAERLFRKCGVGFIAEENCRFNFGQNIEVGDFVFFNRGVFIDSKGGVVIGHRVALTENVQIFTHTHSESTHTLREYHPVIIKDYAKIYTGATIFPGVTIGEEAIVAAHSVVMKDVEPGMLVAGTPAQAIRPRKKEGKSGDDLDHLWLF